MGRNAMAQAMLIIYVIFATRCHFLLWSALTMKATKSMVGAVLQWLWWVWCGRFTVFALSVRRITLSEPGKCSSGICLEVGRLTGYIAIPNKHSVSSGLREIWVPVALCRHLATVKKHYIPWLSETSRVRDGVSRSYYRIFSRKILGY